MKGSRYNMGILFADDDIRQARFSFLISLTGDDWLKFKKAPVYQELMDWLKESDIPFEGPRQREPEPKVPSLGEYRGQHPVLRLVVTIISSIFGALLTLKLCGVI